MKLRLTSSIFRNPFYTVWNIGKSEVLSIVSLALLGPEVRGVGISGAVLHEARLIADGLLRYYIFSM